MKFFPYLGAAVLGAALAGVATYRPPSSTAEGGDKRSPAQAETPPAVEPPSPTGPDPMELARLARENAELRENLAEIKARLERADLTLARTRENLDELRRPMTEDLLSSTLRAELKSGEVIVTGGYALPDGTRRYAFIQPMIEQVEGKDVVRIESAIRTITDPAGREAGLEGLATNAGNTLQHGEVWLAEEQRAVLGALDIAAGTRGETFPAFTVPPGVTSQIELGDLHMTVTPIMGADRQNLDFEVRLEQARPAEPGQDGAAESASP